MSAKAYLKWLDEMIAALETLDLVVPDAASLERILGAKGLAMMLENQPDFSARDFLAIGQKLLAAAKTERRRLIEAMV